MTEPSASEPRQPGQGSGEIVVDDVLCRKFNLIEDQVRFRFVPAWQGIHLHPPHRPSGNPQKKLIGDVYDFGLALELGISTKSGWSFMALGLSRIAAMALQPKFPDSNLTLMQRAGG